MPKIRRNSLQGNDSDDEIAGYRDDLNFLNKLDPNKISRLSSMFRNVGRGQVKQDRLFLEKNKLTPVVGSYRPKHSAV